MSTSKWNCSICTFENKISCKICEMCAMGKSPDSAQEKGVVGLKNFGNTSSLNSVIQCLIQSPYFREYFLSNNFVNDINKENPLGFGGQIATIWGALLNNIFSAKYAIFEPTEFQQTINQLAPRFTNDEEHDAHQILSFLLNALHEDLNKNKSIITKQFTAQYKSMVLCPDCNYSSDTFIPYNILSIPIATEKYKIIQYTFIEADTSIKPTIYGQKILKVADIEMLKQTVSKTVNTRYKKQESYDIILACGFIRKYEKQLKLKQVIPNGIIQLFCDFYVFIHPVVDRADLFVCDIWKSKIHRELRRHDCVNDINRKSDDIFIYNVPTQNIDTKHDKTDNYKQKSQTFVVDNQHRIVARQHAQYMENPVNPQPRYEDEAIGFPLLVRFPMDEPVTVKQICNSLWKIIKPFFKNEFTQTDDNLPFQFWTAWGVNSHHRLVYDDDEIFDLHQRNLKFLIHWIDTSQYKSSLYEISNRIRHVSAPTLDVSFNRKQNKDVNPVNLTQCIELFCEETKLSDTAWKCPECKDVKRATKQITLSNSPNLLILHLQRFSYTQNPKDRINTLVQFPLKGLDLSPYLQCNDAKDDAFYDLYAITNHIANRRNGVYSANTKNLDNSQWYSFNDINTAKVHDTNALISSNAYILYYSKRTINQDML